MKNFRVDIIVIDDDLEANSVRSAVEWFSGLTRAFYIGKAQDLVDVFKKEKLSPYILIAAHGDVEGDENKSPWGFKLPELGEKLEKQQPYHKILYANDIAEFVKLDGQNILSLACCTGSKEIADAFLKSGAGSYIGPSKAPFGTTSLYFAISFYYWLIARDIRVKEAFEKAMQTIDQDIDKFTFFEK